MLVPRGSKNSSSYSSDHCNHGHESVCATHDRAFGPHPVMERFKVQLAFRGGRRIGITVIFLVWFHFKDVEYIPAYCACLSTA